MYRMIATGTLNQEKHWKRLDEAAALINEAAGEEELDPTVLPYELEEIVGNIKMEGDKLSDNMKRQNINLWIAAMGTGIEPTL
ncbi:unnamed protein product [Enterobius vermicularis]|uniref:TnpV protein n=1 Tax=Enterobius vermicularis TaxID=51028 RepID=A0A0N4V1Y3_ENTVE|nr:unnamed protein product [Enterobius vermicularis]